MFLVLYSACIGSRTIVRIDEAIRALRQRRTSNAALRRLAQEGEKGACMRVCGVLFNMQRGEAFSSLKGYWVQLRLRASLAVLMADSAGGGGYAMCGWPE